MSLRRLLSLNAILLASLGALWALDSTLAGRREARRIHESAFRPVVGDGSIGSADIALFELRLPRTGESWAYARREEGWRLPRDRDVFARGPELEGFLRALLESRGTVVGDVSSEAPHFGLGRDEAPEVRLRGPSGLELARVRIGRSPPGERAGECFLSADGDDAILHMNANPWPLIERPAGARLPPLADGRIIPGALVRGSLERIRFSGPETPAADGGSVLESLQVKTLPPVFPRDRGPRYEWYGVFAGEAERRVADGEAWRYANAISSLAFDEILGSPAPSAPAALPPETGLAEPTLSVRVEYGEGSAHTLELGALDERGFHYLRNATTGQVFAISLAKAKSLVSDVAALLEPEPEPGPKPGPGPGPGPESGPETGSEIAPRDAPRKAPGNSP